MGGRQWTSDEDCVLANLWDSSCTLEEIAAYLPGRTHVSVQVRAKRLGLRHTSEQTSAIISKKCSGARNGMFGKPGPRRGVVLTKEQREHLRDAALRGFKEGSRKPLCGSMNPSFGRPSTMRGKHLPASAKSTLSLKGKVRWAAKTPDEQAKKIQQLREGWQWLGLGNPSSIEITVSKWLGQLGVVHEAQARVGFYLVDFLVGDKVVECHGDYWHANPLSYAGRTLSPMQTANVLRDRRKATYLRNQGYDLLVVWEHEIKTAPIEVLAALERFLT